MKSALEKLLEANRWRIKTGKLASQNNDGFRGHFLVPMEGELWHVHLSDEMGWFHVSVTNAQKRALPTWRVMNRVKEAFFADDTWACQFFPAKADHLNDEQNCLHIWAPIDEKLPTPHYVLV